MHFSPICLALSVYIPHYNLCYIHKIVAMPFCYIIF